ncbi:MAG: ABC transporter permease [Mycobacterium leprae]
MGKYFVRRLLQAIPVLIGITIISFFIVNMAPGDPALLYMDRSSNPTKEDIAKVRHDLGLDKPLPIRYLDWVSRAATGDFGNSFVDKRPVIKKISEALPYTLTLALSSLVVAYVLAILLGVLAAVKNNTWIDWIISGLSALFVSVPVFWISLMAVLLFAVKWKLVPTSGWQTYGDGSIFDILSHLILPVFMLALHDVAALSRYVRSGLLETLRADFVRTARSKGVSERVAIFKHALRNALIPVVTCAGLTLPWLVGGAVVTERVFALPGMGRLTLDAVNGRDYPTIIAINLMLSIMVVLGNMLADVTYGLVDPRIRYS